MKITRRRLLTGAVAVPATAGTAAWLLAEPGPHEPAEISITTANGKRLVSANGMPDHAIGDFPKLPQADEGVRERM